MQDENNHSMQIGDLVEHKTYGIGTIADGIGTDFIKIRFGKEIKGFPKIFFSNGFLKYLGRSAAVKGSNTPNQRKSKPKQQEDRNVFFKCNYCDGGTDGFCGMCSDDIIRWNLKKGRDWCIRSECAEYIQSATKISRQRMRKEMEQRWRENGDSFCTESVFLKTWQFCAEQRMQQIGKGGLAVMTTEPPKQNERVIFAVFLIDAIWLGQKYNGDDTTWVAAQETANRLILTELERAAVRFSKYYTIKWGSGLFRYLSDETAKQILEDICHAAYRPEALQLYRQYCETHPHLTPDTNLLELETPMQVQHIHQNCQRVLARQIEKIRNKKG